MRRLTDTAKQVRAVKGRPDERPDAQEFGRIRSRLARAGVSQATIREWIGDDVRGRTRKEIADALIERLRALPKAGQ